jgi:hypothetical protein
MWVLQQLTKSAPPEIPWRCFFDEDFLLMARDSLRRVHENWPQALQFHLNAASLPILEEAAGRPWPNLSFRRAVSRLKQNWLGLSALLLLLNITIRQPAAVAIVCVTGLLIFAVSTAWRIAYPLWILPAAKPLLQRFGQRPQLQLAWYLIRLAIVIAACIEPLLPPQYGDAIYAAIMAASLTSAMLLLALNRQRALARSWIAAIFCAALLAPSSSNLPPPNWLMLLLAGTICFGLRDILRVYNRSWDTPGNRLLLLLCATKLIPHQVDIANGSLMFATVSGWLLFIAGCAVVDLFGLQAKWFTTSYRWIVVMILLVIGSRALSHSLVASDNPVAGILSLQFSVVIAATSTLMVDGWRWWQRRKSRHTD